VKEALPKWTANSLPDEEFFILKGASRGSKQIYSPTLLGAFGNTSAIEGSEGLVAVSPCNVGEVIFAAISLLAEDWVYADAKISEQQLTIILQGKCCGTKENAKEIITTLKLSPRKRMARDGRDTPGSTVLALDYIKPLSIGLTGTKPEIKIKFTVQGIS